MKKRIVQSLLVFALVASVLPLSASACGGFVSVKGEKTFHSVYCENLVYENLDKMRWFDTAKKAENSGLKMCEDCSDHYDWDFDSELCNTYWATDDHLLLTAMELSLEYGHEIGSENAAEEYNNYYESGYDAGYDAGYYEGTQNGAREAERKIEAENKEIRENRWGLVFIILVAVCIPIILNAIDSSTRKRKLK